MKRDKVLTIQVDSYLRRRVEEIVEACKDLQITKSDVGYAILHSFFVISPPDRDLQAVRDFILAIREEGNTYPFIDSRKQGNLNQGHR